MKHLKMSMMLLLTVAFFTSCDKESITLQENAGLNNQPIVKENLSARPLDIAAGDLYALFPWDWSDNVALYNYNPTIDEIVLNEGFRGSTGKYVNIGFDFNPKDGLIYLLTSDDYDCDCPRYLYTYNKDTDEVTYIDQIESVEGSIFPQDLTFGNDGTLYFVFKSGEINSYKVITKTMNAFSVVPSDGAVGLTYDFDNNQLIYATNNGPVELYSINIPTGNRVALFDYYTPINENRGGQAIEYVGNNKLIASGTSNMNIIYTVDLGTEEVNLLLNPTGSFRSIKDLMFLGNNPDLDGDGVLNENDPYPNSNMSETISIGGCYTNVNNVIVRNGTTMMDQIDALIAEINSQYNGRNYEYLHRKFIMLLERKVTDWRRNRLVTNSQRDAILRCAGSARIPYFDQPF